MSKVLIFTNWNSLYAIKSLRKRVRVIWNEQSYPSRDMPFFRCAFTGAKTTVLSPVGNCLEGGVYLVFDHMVNPYIELLKDNCMSGEVLVLVHTNMSHSINNVLNELALSNESLVVKHGIHDDSNMFYSGVFKVLVGEETDKESLIYRILKPSDSKGLLNIALKFFDACMAPKNDKIIKDIGVEMLLNDNVFGYEISNFYYNDYKNGDTFREYKDYYQSLRTVSDKVISIIVDRVNKEKLSRKDGM